MLLTHELLTLLPNVSRDDWQIDFIKIAEKCVYCCSSPNRDEVHFRAVAVYSEHTLISISLYKMREVKNIDSVYEEVRQYIKQNIINIELNMTHVNKSH
jgi:hypothetical protein